MSILAAYSFSRFEFRFKRSFNMFIISVQAVPPITLLIPYFGLLVAMKLYNTFMQAWNEYLFALTLTKSESMRTVPIGIQLLMGEKSYE